MKLSDLYTTGTVAKRNNDGSSVAYVCTRPLSELYPDLDMEFDPSILFCNGSTSELMSNKAEMLNMDCFITRNENEYNLDIPDNLLPLQEKTVVYSRTDTVNAPDFGNGTIIMHTL